MKKEYEVTVSATITRTVTVYAWNNEEAEDAAVEMFEDGIRPNYEYYDVEVVEVTGG